MDSVPHDPAPGGSDLQQPIKLLFKWAHQEFKTDNLYQVPSAKLSSQAKVRIMFANVMNVVDALKRKFVSFLGACTSAVPSKWLLFLRDA